MSCALFSARNALYSTGGGASGWGLGFIQGGDVLLQKRPRAGTSEVDLYSLSRDLKANAFIGRVGLGRGGNITAENADPFRYRSWLFGSVGHVPSFDAIREGVLEAIPAYLRRNLRGTSASEHLFHLFLAFLHDAGILDQPSPPLSRVEAALHSTIAFVTRLSKAADDTETRHGHGMEIAVVATNGRTLVAAACSHAMQFLRIDGIADCPVCQGRTNPDRDGRRISHEGLRAVIIEANAETQGRVGWKPIPDQSALIVGPDHLPRVKVLGAPD